jgi:hypothetical protein
MAAPRVGEQLVVQDPLEGPEQDSGQVALIIRSTSVRRFLRGKSQRIKSHSQASGFQKNSQT